MNRYVRSALAAVAVIATFVAGVVLLSATTAQATEETICSTWAMRGHDGETWTGKPQGATIADHRAKLVKAQPASEGALAGVEFATYDLDVQAPEDGTVAVTVKYELGEGASFAAGAVRMFGYADQDANTASMAPDHVAIADAGTGTLTFALPAGGTLGTLGLVYDGSNNATGWVKFRQLKIGGTLVRFTACPEPEPIVTSVSPSPSVSASSSASVTPQPSASSSAGPVVAGRGASLPVTGPGGIGFAIVGLMLIVGGILAVALPAVRRRKL